MKADGDVHVRIPGSVAEAMGLPAKQLQEEMRRELALVLYAQDRLSGGQARELAGMDRRASIQLLGKRQIPRHYGKEELEEDLHYARGE